jgi:hypothetical protein
VTLAAGLDKEVAADGRHAEARASPDFRCLSSMFFNVVFSYLRLIIPGACHHPGMPTGELHSLLTWRPNGGDKMAADLGARQSCRPVTLRRFFT